MLVRELQSLALDISVLDADGNEIKLKESTVEESGGIRNFVMNEGGEEGVVNDVTDFIKDEDENEDAETDEKSEDDEDIDDIDAEGDTDADADEIDALLDSLKNDSDEQ